ncbi:MAG TPA: MDR family MFS transporter [Acidimicrobiales bacterium]
MSAQRSPAELRDAVSRRPILIALMVTIGIAALDNTIVSTAIPSIVRGLGGFSEFPWVFSIYLLTQAVTVPIYGRLADIFGRRPVLFVGIGIFLLGSALSGAAWSMPTLIVFRGLQGIGAGAVQPVAMTIVGDLYTVEERGRIQGYLSGVWGVAAVVGPALGGTLSQYASWRWIFYLNLPVGAIAAVMLARHLHEQVVRQTHRIDYAGAIALMGGMTLLILGLLQGDVHWAWTSPAELVVLSAAFALIVAFVEIERRASEPFMPPWLFKWRTLVAGNLAGLAIGALLIGLTSYVPTFAQGVVGVGPVLAGFALAGESVTWVLGSVVSGRLYGHTGFRFTALIGSCICLSGAIAFAFLRSSVSLGLIAVAGSIVGLGFGFVATSVIVAVQSTVGWDRRGVVTGANMFGRTIGGALGVAVFGSIANSSLVGWLRNPPVAIAAHLPHGANAAALILGGSSAIHDHAASSFVRQGLFLAVHHVFLAFVVIAIALATTVAAIPRRVVAISFEPSVAAKDPVPTNPPAAKQLK